MLRNIGQKGSIPLLAYYNAGGHSVDYHVYGDDNVGYDGAAHDRATHSVHRQARQKCV